jgi:hypothetical protein
MKQLQRDLAASNKQLEANTVTLQNLIALGPSAKSTPVMASVKSTEKLAPVLSKLKMGLQKSKLLAHLSHN